MFTMYFCELPTRTRVPAPSPLDSGPQTVTLLIRAARKVSRFPSCLLSYPGGSIGSLLCGRLPRRSHTALPQPTSRGRPFDVLGLLVSLIDYLVSGPCSLCLRLPRLVRI